MSWFTGTKNTGPSQRWHQLEDILDLDEVWQASFARPQLIFKHSTRCIISKTVLKNWESAWHNDCFDGHYLDLIAHRDISREIEARSKVSHESPQAILLSQGKVLYQASHSDIDITAVEALC